MVYPDCSKLLNDFDSNMLSDGFVKKAYSAILNRINDGLELNLMSFGDTFTDNEYSRLARLINNDCESNDSKAEFNDCLKIIEEEYNKNSKHDAYYSYNFTDYSPGEYNSAIGIKFDKYAINRV